jgi:phage baseplate assembly protein V
MADPLAQIRHHLRPLANKIANSLARAVVGLVDDTTKLQLVQLGVLAGETVDRAEHHQPYGFTSVPLAGAEAVVLFPNGDRAHPLVVTVSDRRYRPTGGDPGEVTVHNHVTGCKVVLTKDGDIIATPAAGRTVKIMSAGGTALAIPTMADFNALRAYVNNQFSAAGGHTHVVSGAATTTIAAVATQGPSPPTTVPASPTGTTVLKAE